MGVVVQLPAVDEAAEVGAQRFDVQPGDETGQVVGVGADVADAAAGPGLCRVGAPGGLFLAGGSRGLQSASPARIPPGRRGARQARRSPPSRAPGAPSGSRCSCGSRRRSAPVLLGQRHQFFAPRPRLRVMGLSQITWMPRFEKGLGDAGSARGSGSRWQRPRSRPAALLRLGHGRRKSS